MEENESKVYSKVPAKVSAWTSFKNFLFQDIVVELTPGQKKVFQEVKNFWNQEVYFDKGFHLRPRQVASVTVDNVETNEPEVQVNL